MRWKEELDEAVTEIDSIARHLSIPQGEVERLREVAAIHPLRITRTILDRIDPRDPNDPLRRMFVPNLFELDASGEYDTSGERTNTKVTGLQHKYGPTVLLLSTNRCAAYCRYCFRKRLVGLSSTEILDRFDSAVEYIRDHPEVTNVLISGGDPMVLPTAILRQFLERLAEIPHLQFIRFGTKTVATLPQRWIEDDELLDLLQTYGRTVRPIYIVTHIGHPRELSPESFAAVRRIRDAGLTVSNQTVLLNGVNDNADTLVELMNALVKAGIVPYYLFQCRPVSRVQNGFQVPLVRGYRIVQDARVRLNGHAKRFRFAMSHRIGKVEILGVSGGSMFFQMHEAKIPEHTGLIFSRPVDDLGGWLPNDVDPTLTAFPVPAGDLADHRFDGEVDRYRNGRQTDRPADRPGATHDNPPQR